MKQAIKPDCNNVNYNDLTNNYDEFLIFLKNNNNIIGFIMFNVNDGCFEVYEASSDYSSTGETYLSLDEIVDTYNRRLKIEVTIWYENVLEK